MLKKIIIIVFCASLAWGGFSAFAANDTTTIQSNIEKLRVLMLTPDTAKLNRLVADQLIYVHSDGHFNNKATFVSDLMTGVSHFTALEFKEQTVTVVGDVGIVRHILTGDTQDKGKAPAHVNIRVMQIWQKKAGHWKLLARQSAPILAPAPK
jgi:ketosteroid isomerase-like protein